MAWVLPLLLPLGQTLTYFYIYIKGTRRIKLSPVLYCEDKFISDCENFHPCCEGPWKYLERTINFQAVSIA